MTCMLRRRPASALVMWCAAVWCTIVCTFAASSESAAQPAAGVSGPITRIDLAAADAAKSWVLPESTSKVCNGELVLDGRQHVSRAFYEPSEWGDVRLEARFRVEPAESGVLACGFVIRAVDANHRYYVHFDRGQAILCRSDAGKSWIEIRRVGGLDKPAGRWHTGCLEAQGDTLRVHLNGKLLYEAKDAALRGGRIGFYAGQGLVHVKDIVVTGSPQTPQRPLVIPKPNFVYVCEDAGAGGYEAFPDVCRLSDGRLMCVFYAGYGHVAMPNAQLPKGGRIAYCTSADEGHTWSPAKTLYDSPDDDRDPSIVQLRNGKLICNFFSLRNKPSATAPWTGLGTWIVTSDDLGRTWSPARQIYKDDYCSTPIREMPDGRLVLGMYREGPNSATGSIGLSDDGGKTWLPVVEIPNGGIRLDAETDVIRLRDGTYYAALRAHACYSVSKDRGATWSTAKPIGFPAHCPYFLRTRDDIILLAHRLPETSLHYSLDECKTWSANVPVDDVGGAYPSMVNLKDGSVLIVYYEEGEGSSIRAKRFRATRKGIEWLTP